MTNAALIIDLDGTLYDSDKIDEENKLAAIEAISDHLKITSVKATNLFKTSHSVSQRSTASILRDFDVPDALVKHYQLKIINPEKVINPDPELVMVLGRLKAKFKLVLLTNTRREIALRILKALTLCESDFDLILAGGDFPEPKPNIDILKSALNVVDCSANLSYTVGDRWLVDHAPGQVLDMKAIEVNGRDELIQRFKSLLEATDSRKIKPS